MAGLIGMVIGGVILLMILSLGIEKFIVQNIVDDPLFGKIASLVAAWLIAGTIGGFGFANGLGFVWGAYLLYGIAGIVLLPFAIYGGYRIRRTQHDDIGETFE